MASGGPTDWVVAVYSGPSSSDNLTTVLVSWARRHGLDPRYFHVWLDNGGKALVLRGFTSPLVSDFLSYARSQSFPPLICGPPSQRVSSPPSSPQPPLPQPPTSTPAPSPPADSSPLMQGVLQVLTDRETAVNPVEHRLMEVFGTLDLKESEVLWSLYLTLRKEVPPTLVALASSPSLRSQGAKMFAVPEEELLTVLFPTKSASKSAKAPLPAEPVSEDNAARMDTYKRVLESNAAHWQNVLERLQNTGVKEGQMSAAVVVEEGEGKVTWVFPRAPSPVVKAISACVLHLHETSLSGEKATLHEVRDTVVRASKLAHNLGLSLRWYMVSSGKVLDVPEAPTELSGKDLSYLNALLSHYGGATWLLGTTPAKSRKGGKSAKPPAKKAKP